MRHQYFIILLVCAMGLYACSSDEAAQAGTDSTPAPVQQANTQPVQQPVVSEPVEGATPKQESSNREKQLAELKALIPEGLTKLPETAEDFYNMPVGRFAGKQYYLQKEEIEKVIAQFPVLKDPNPDQEILEMYYLALLGLFAEDYPEPDEIINQIKLSSFGSPEMDDPRFQFKEQYNVMIVLDASGSMGEMVGNKTRMEAAKEAIRSFAASIPEGAQVGLRVYGHEGSGAESQKELSCSKSDVMYPLQAYDAKKLDGALAQFKPAGWTPIALALQKAQEDLKDFNGEKSTNIIYIVSDGIETCGGDPVEAARQLGKSDITPIVNVVGFGVDGEGQRQLKQVAEAAGGRYVLIQDQNELQKELEQAKEIAHRWAKWRRGASQEASSQKTSQSLEIHAFDSNWHQKSVRESYNFMNAFHDVREQKIMDKEALEQLKKIEDQQDKLIEQQGEKLELFLEELNEKSYKEAVTAIQQTYKDNTKGN
jgi:Ca-activated chloride channel homolog